jgi:hypothetical protein
MGRSRTDESQTKGPATSWKKKGTDVGARSKSGEAAAFHEDPNDRKHMR